MFDIQFRKVLLIALLATVASAASGGVFINELDAASNAKRGAMCSPLLRKTSGIFEIPLSRKADSLGIEERPDLASNLFQIYYRTIALEKYGERSAPDIVNRAWNTTADDVDLKNPKTRYRTMNKCIAVYASLRKSGHITKEDEEIALELAKKEVTAILK